MTGLVNVLMLGTFHFISKLDMFTSDVDDMGASSRQAELETLTRQLAIYRPTKVLIERPYADRVAVNADYASYLRGTRQLCPDEAEQIGFRLAAACEHDVVYPVDIMHRWYEESVESILAADPNAQGLWELIQQEGREVMSDLSGVLATSNVSETLRYLNVPAARAAYLHPYTRDFVRLVSGENYAGADMVGNWYFRNARICANICRSSAPGDRLVLVYGAGHIPVLEHLLSSAGVFALEDPLSYLG